MIVVDECDASGLVSRNDVRSRCHILELAVAEIAKQQHAIIHGNGEIVQFVAVVIAYGAGDGMAVRVEASGLDIQFF